MVFSDPIPQLVVDLAGELRRRALKLATIESCTGGLLGAAITSLAGVSDAYVGGFVTYSNGLKNSCVGVSAAMLELHGAVSPEVAIAMVRGGCARTAADIGISVTGVAGPSGGTPAKPVGTVWIAVAAGDRLTDTRRFLFPGDRHEVRRLTVIAALRQAIAALGDESGQLEHEQERWNA